MHEFVSNYKICIKDKELVIAKAIIVRNQHCEYIELNKIYGLMSNNSKIIAVYAHEKGFSACITDETGQRCDETYNYISGGESQIKFNEFIEKHNYAIIIENCSELKYIDFSIEHPMTFLPIEIYIINCLKINYCYLDQSLYKFKLKREKGINASYISFIVPKIPNLYIDDTKIYESYNIVLKEINDKQSEKINKLKTELQETKQSLEELKNLVETLNKQLNPPIDPIYYYGGKN